MPSAQTLYETDVFLWTQTMADLLLLTLYEPLVCLERSRWSLWAY